MAGVCVDRLWRGRVAVAVVSMVAAVAVVGALVPAAVAAPAAYKALVLGDGAVSYWSFDDCLIDPCDVVDEADPSGLVTTVDGITSGILEGPTPNGTAMVLTSVPAVFEAATVPGGDRSIEAWISDETYSVAGSGQLSGPVMSWSGLGVRVEVVSDFPFARDVVFTAGDVEVAAVSLENAGRFGPNGAVHVAMTVAGSQVTAYLSGVEVGSVDAAGLGLVVSSSITVGGEALGGGSGPIDGGGGGLPPDDGGGGLPPDDGGGGLPPDDVGGGLPPDDGGPGDAVRFGVLDELAVYARALSGSELLAHVRAVAPLGLVVEPAAVSSANTLVANLVFTNHGTETLGSDEAGVSGTVAGGSGLVLSDPIGDTVFDLGPIAPGESRTIQRVFDVDPPDPQDPDAESGLVLATVFSPRQSFAVEVVPVGDPLGTGVGISIDEARWFVAGQTPTDSHPVCLSNVSASVTSFVMACWTDEQARQGYLDALVADGFEDGVDDVIWIGNFDEEPVRP